MPNHFLLQGCLSLPFICVQISSLLEKRIVGKSDERFISVLFIDSFPLKVSNLAWFRRNISLCYSFFSDLFLNKAIDDLFTFRRRGRKILSPFCFQTRFPCKVLNLFLVLSLSTLNLIQFVLQGSLPYLFFQFLEIAIDVSVLFSD